MDDKERIGSGKEAIRLTQHHPIRRRVDPAYVAMPLAMLAALIVVAAFTGQWPTASNPYNSYVLQARAWLAGRLDLGRNYPWLELAVLNGRYYVSFPPFPSYVMLPFAALLRGFVPDNALAWAMTMLGALYAARLYRLLRRDDRLAFWVLFLYLGTGCLFISLNGYVWFIAQSMCFTLSLMALTHAKLGQGGIALACWACAVGCRPTTILYLPVLIWLLWPDKGSESLPRWILRRWVWGIAPLLLAGSYMALNYARFGSPLEFGHNYLPEFLRAEHGQFSLTYLPDNLRLLLRLPGWDADNNRVVFFTGQTMAFWLMNPMFFCVAAAWAQGVRQRRDVPTLVLLPVLALAHGVILCCHRTLGGWQFGNRYLVDMMPWLFAGMLLWTPRGERLTRGSTALWVWGVALNLIGTVATYNDWI